MRDQFVVFVWFQSDWISEEIRKARDGLFGAVETTRAQQTFPFS